MNPLNHVDRAGRELAEKVGDDGLDKLIEKHIEPDPHGRGIADAAIKGRGVSVWVIRGEIEGGKGDFCYAAESFRIPVDDVRGALAFYWRNRMMIRARIALNSNDPAYVELEA
ncbi:MAG: hypothetical protein H0V47_16240 [Chloroflexia bacterium]|nr:hypothetical protein [Chloroflexia bacterium]